MKKWVKISIWVVCSLIVIFAFFAQWYKQTYSMEPAKAFEVNVSTSPQHLLIATQGSTYKDSIVHILVGELKKNPLYIKVIDVSDLTSINESEWSAIVILHTWEFSKPPEAVKTFIDRANDRSKIVALSTSGDGNFKIDGVDAISSASVLNDSNAVSAKILSRLKLILKYN